MKKQVISLLIPIMILFLSLSLLYYMPSSETIELVDTYSDDDLEAEEYCLDCHEDYDSALSSTAHYIGSLPHGKILMCISCHSGAAAHIEDPEVENSIGNPTELSQLDQFSICGDCHMPHMEMDNIGFDPHLEADLSCASCHSVHSGFNNLMLDETEDFCGQCHISVLNQFKRVSNHPVTDGNVSCLSCHDFTGKLQPNFGHGSSANCNSCHPMESGPFFFEHEVTSGFSPDGGGCISCHAPHGSSNGKLLTRPDNSLCQQCHGTPAAHFTAHNGIGVQNNCMECHSEIHGSNDNRNFLDRNLDTKVGSRPGSCFCHNVSW